ncbi:MAG: hypothetical protein IKP06_03780 [Elusimicrobiaceae bacterium]|nr:hypothetical protein [Elusimicrobiaceae bacterium]
MTQQTDLRSGMLATIYQMLPGINDDYAARLVYTLENKKSIAQLQQDIADTAAQLNSDSPSCDTLVAKILLDEITLHAALRQLRIYNNATSIAELGEALKLPAPDIQKLLDVYASFSSHQYFDQIFAAALKDLETQTSLSDTQKASLAVKSLLDQATQWLASHRQIIQQNKKDILALADQYHLPLKTTAELELLYTQPGSIAFKEEVDSLIAQLKRQNSDERLCASLAAYVMLGKLTPKNAEDTALVSNLVGGLILEDDLLIIACRYLKTKTPADIVSAFKAVLGKLPHVADPNENLGLAVRVLLEGTPESFTHACKLATVRQAREVLRRRLSQNELYAGYEYDLAEKFGGKKTFPQLEQELWEMLKVLPFCEDETENKELACKVLLGVISQEEATQQAQYLRDLKAQSLTQGLAPTLMKSYLGTKPADEILKFFEDSLSPYTFWKSNRAKHEFALRVLLGELNGTYNRQISRFVLDMLEEGSSLELMTDMLSNIQAHKTSREELDKLLNLYKQARVSSKA